jgi:hypothetical protein
MLGDDLVGKVPIVFSRKQIVAAESGDDVRPKDPIGFRIGAVRYFP